MVNSEQLFKNTSFYNKCWVCCNRSYGGRWLACWAAWPAAAWSHPKYSPTGLVQNLPECGFSEKCFCFITKWTPIIFWIYRLLNTTWTHSCTCSQHELPADQAFTRWTSRRPRIPNTNSCTASGPKFSRLPLMVRTKPKKRQTVEHVGPTMLNKLQCYLA